MKKRPAFLLLLLLALLSGCASTKPPRVFQPGGKDVEWYFLNGLPIGATSDDQSFFLFSLEPAQVSGRRYMRLWLLFQNKSNNPYLVDPQATVTLKVQSFPEIKPDTPTRILSSIDNEKATSLILQAIGGTLQQLSSQSTRVTASTGETWQIQDKKEKQDAIRDKTQADMLSTNYWYETFRNSVSSGILRRNTLFTNRSVNGYVYFELPQDYREYINPEHNVLIVTISTPSGPKRVQFKPIEGE
jgi:hypothetical protein